MAHTALLFCGYLKITDTSKPSLGVQPRNPSLFHPPPNRKSNQSVQYVSSSRLGCSQNDAALLVVDYITAPNI